MRRERVLVAILLLSIWIGVPEKPHAQQALDVLAAPRPALVQFSARLPGSRVVDGRFHVSFAGIAVPKGQSARLSYLNEFVQDAVATGLIQHAIERVGVRGVQVAGGAK